MTCPPCSGNCDQGRDCDAPYSELTPGEAVLYWGIIVIAAVVFVAITAAVLA